MQLMKKKYFDLCHPILEKDRLSIIKKIKSIKNSKVRMYELRLDCLKSLSRSKEGIELVIDDVNYIVSKYPKNVFIATIRTKSEGGNITLSGSKYVECIKYLLKEAKVNYVDIEYKYYEKHKRVLDKYIKESKAKVIISKHIFDKKFSYAKCENMLKQLSKTKCDVVKLAVNVDNIVDSYKFIELSKEYNEKISKSGKRGIFIAMGKAGIISRILPEYTGTRVVFLDAYDKKNSKLFQPNLTFFLKFHNKILDYLDI